MIDLLTLADLEPVLKLLLCVYGFNARNDFAVDGDAALFNQPARLTLGGRELAEHHEVNERDGAIGEALFGHLRARHVLVRTCAGEKGCSGGLGLVGLLGSVDETGELVGENLLLLIDTAAVPLVHFLDGFQRQEGEHADALHHIGIIHIAPVLVELKGRGLIGIKPHSAFGGLTHLLALGVEEQGDGHGKSVISALAADELGAGEHIAPLVIAAELHIAAVMVVQVQEVIALHDHVVELQEAQTLFHALLVAFGAQHVVDGKVGAYIAQELDIVELEEPVGVVDQDGGIRSICLRKHSQLCWMVSGVIMERISVRPLGSPI